MESILRHKLFSLWNRGKARAPTLQTVLMIEEFIEKNSGKYKKTDLFNNLPRQVMWQTYQIVLEYLDSINKIAYDNESYVVYIWSPELGVKYRARKDLAWKKK